MGALISYTNLADGATLTNSSDGTNVLAASRVQTRQIGKAMRQTLSTASPLQSVYLDFDLGSAQSISYVGIFGHNISSGTYAVSLGTSSGASDVASVSGTLWQGVADDPKQQHVILSQTYSAQFVRVTLTPASGQDVDVGRVWIDDPWTPKVSVEFEHTIEDVSDRARSIGGSVYVYERPRYRMNRVKLPKMEETDALGDSSDSTVKSAHHMDMTVGNHSQIVCIPETAGADNTQVQHKLGIIGHIERSTPIQLVESRPSGGGWLYEKRFSVVEER
jgi:hypothetical protein